MFKLSVIKKDIQNFVRLTHALTTIQFHCFSFSSYQLVTQTAVFVSFLFVLIGICLRVLGVSNISSVEEVAKQITVKIYSGDVAGSGILVQRDGNSYYLVTNQHVLDGESNNYTIETFDGIPHPADVLYRFLDHSSSPTDLALLRFSSNNNYSLANLEILEPEQQLIACGFPVSSNTTAATQVFKCSDEMAQAESLPKPMQKGYQIGYSIYVINGMSGGPLVNQQGNVVGINGMGQPKLFVNPELYQYRDGSLVDRNLSELSKLAWAIPVESLVKTCEGQTLGLKILDSYSREPFNAQNTLLPNHELIRLVENTVVPIYYNNLGQLKFVGSGAITSCQEGQYFITSLLDLIDETKSYTIKTSDGQIYPARVLPDHLNGTNFSRLSFESSNTYDTIPLSSNIRTDSSPIYFVGGWIEQSGMLFFSAGYSRLGISQYFGHMVINENEELIGILDSQGQLIFLD